MNKVIYTAIFGEYEELKEPLVVTKGWDYFCFTDQPFKSKVWKIIKTDCSSYGPQLTARDIKINAHLFLPFYEYSIWVDGSFFINTDLNVWFNTRFKAPFTCIKHPIRNCVYDEAQACIKHLRGNPEDIKRQISKYAGLGMPRNNGVISSGILMRRNCEEVNNFCEKWFNEVKENSMRDQLAFSFVSWKNRIHNLTRWDYRTEQEFKFLTHYNRRRNGKTY